MRAIITCGNPIKHFILKMKSITPAPEPLEITLDMQSFMTSSEYNTTIDLKEMKTITIIFYSITFILGMFGNSTIIWVTGFKMKKTMSTVWFLNLAVADLIFVFTLPWNIIYRIMDLQWPFGKYFCKFNIAALYLHIFVSNFLIAVVSIDQFCIVAYPLWSRNHRTVMTATVVALISWASAVCLCLPYFIFAETYTNMTKCQTNFLFDEDYEKHNTEVLLMKRTNAFFALRLLCSFIIPFSTIVTCYITIIWKLRRNYITQYSKPFKVFLAVIAVFVICWFPYYIVDVIDVIYKNSVNKDYYLEKAIDYGRPLADGLVYFNSCINTMMYLCMSQGIREICRKPIWLILKKVFSDDFLFSTVSRSYSASGTCQYTVC
ncbi:formyl peptide receptor 2-like [Protopterus annectens]|uniref:formyl peptide receptor 2-like n=1 Tax=Protopterus annectens TaxID=7888 RepID=UPI001CF99421|nr:formyl peptide receptor 2-like [Protopterus annectens]